MSILARDIEGQVIGASAKQGGFSLHNLPAPGEYTVPAVLIPFIAVGSAVNQEYALFEIEFGSFKRRFNLEQQNTVFIFWWSIEEDEEAEADLVLSQVLSLFGSSYQVLQFVKMSSESFLNPDTAQPIVYRNISQYPSPLPDPIPDASEGNIWAGFASNTSSYSFGVRFFNFFPGSVLEREDYWTTPPLSPV